MRLFSCIFFSSRSLSVTVLGDGDRGATAASPASRPPTRKAWPSVSRLVILMDARATGSKDHPKHVASVIFRHTNSVGRAASGVELNLNDGAAVPNKHCLTSVNARLVGYGES